MQFKAILKHLKNNTEMFKASSNEIQGIIKLVFFSHF
jgi:hypothetical protein